MKDSDIICRLIYCAWIAPVPDQEELDGFRAVLDCFARAVERENLSVTLKSEQLLQIMEENADHAGDRQTDRQTDRQRGRNQ